MPDQDRDGLPAVLSGVVAAELASIRERISDIRAEVSQATATAAAASAQIVSHVAVCDERQRQLELRRTERERIEDERMKEWRTFMAESRVDREAIRVEVRDWAIKLLVVVVLCTLSIIGAFIIAGGLKLFGK